jgi:hypothetical protein
MAHEAGKGSRPRPFSVTQQEYDQRWDAIFGRDLKDDKEEKSSESNNKDTTEKNS